MNKGKLKGKIKEIVKLYQMGESSTSIAKAYGVSVSAIMYHLIKKGVKMRKSCCVISREMAQAHKPYQCEPLKCNTQKPKRAYVRRVKVAEPPVPVLPPKRGVWNTVKLMLAAIHI